MTNNIKKIPISFYKINLFKFTESCYEIPYRATYCNPRSTWQNPYAAVKCRTTHPEHLKWAASHLGYNINYTIYLHAFACP